MASLVERFTGYKPLTYEVSVAVVGGQFVMYDGAAPVNNTTGYKNAVPKVKVATAHATNWLGMAKYDGAPGGEFDETTAANYNVNVNAPNPRLVACPHMGVYEVVNAGDAAILPGDAIEIVTADGKPGKTTAGMVGGRAVVGTAITAGAPGATFRLRLGRD